MNLYKYRMSCNLLYRVGFSILKIVLVVGSILLLAICAFGLLGIFIAYLDNPHLMNNGINFRGLLRWYQCKDKNTSGYIPSIIGATVTALLTAITIYQSYYIRKHDRVFSFSKNEVSRVFIELDREKIVYYTDPYLKLHEGKFIINLEYNETFSTYYEGNPIVGYAILDTREGRKFKLCEKLCIYASAYYVKDKKYNLLLETSDSKLIRIYSNKLNENRDYKLMLLLDIRWCNRLLPWYSRGMSALYIREIIELSRKKESSKKYENCYKVNYMKHKYGYLFSFQWILILLTKLWLTIEDKRKKIDNKRLKRE